MSLEKIFQASDDANIDSERLLIAARNGNSFVEKNKIEYKKWSSSLSLEKYIRGITRK